MVALLKERFREPLEALKVFLDSQTRAFDPKLSPLLDYVLSNEGKRIRPCLVFASGYGGRDAESLVRFAAILELIHIATLVHDDVLDQADIRHNSLALHQRYEPSVAVLVGDVLLCEALRLTTDFKSHEMCRSIAMATRRVCIGEIRQNLHPLNEEASLQDYTEIVARKTATLFQLACHWGAQLGGYPEDFVHAAHQFGTHLGIAFQALDDLNDVFGEESHSGKTLGTDLELHKITLPSVLWMQSIHPDSRAQALEVLKSGNIRDFREQLQRKGGLAKSLDFVHQQMDQARQALIGFEAFASHPILLELAHFLETQASLIVPLSRAS